MNEQPEKPQSTSDETERLKSLKTTTGIVYLCQVLAFGFAGIPLLVGVIINYVKRDEVRGTYLESHFNWQVKTVWVTLLLLAIAGVTVQFGIGVFILIATILWLVYRIVLGWNALSSNKPIGND